MSSKSDDLILAGLGFGFGIYGFFWGFKRLRRKRLVENIPISRIKTWMKILAFVLFIFLTPLFPAHAQSEAFGGRDWIRFLPVMKISYISGLYDASAIIHVKLSKELSKKEINAVITLPENIPFKDVSQRLDEFYGDMENIDIPIIYALSIIKMELEEKSREEISEYKSSLFEIISTILP